MAEAKTTGKKFNPDIVTLGLKQTLIEKEQEFHGTDDIFGLTLLTNPGYMSGPRSVMFTSHMRQFVNLTNPDFPRVFTNYENTVGKNSTGIYKAKSDLKIIDKISKFEDGVHDNHLYLLFTYDKENDKYEIVEKKVLEDLTEKFGYKYNNDSMDKKEINDKVKKGEVLYKTTSYDEEMNYCYGKNVKFMYLLENNTIEDAIVVCDSLAKTMKSIEVETVKVSLNDNDMFCNIYGDNTNYKCFPDINENVKEHILCAKRRIHNNQLLFDTKQSNLRKINFTSDFPSFIDGRVVDINVYCNKPIEEIEENIFNKQLMSYIRMQRAFYQKVFERCEAIINSGSSYSNDINFYYQKAKNILDPEYLWREEDNSVFSNIVVEFLVEREIGLSVGQKITGRYGNKGVISKILPDDQMPYFENGDQVQVIFNSLGKLMLIIL